MTDSSAKVKYRAFCENEPTLGLFRQAWWLDALCGAQSWDVALVEKGAEIVAALPYKTASKYGFRVLSQPAYTPHLGPWMKKTDAKLAERYAREKDLMTALISSLPRFDYFQQQWPPDITNWLPFYWKGFQQKTIYTYCLDNIASHEALWSGFRENVRTDIRKAERRNQVSVSTGTVDDIIQLQEMTFRRQKLSVSYSADLLRSIDIACAEKKCRRIFVARGPDGQAHAGAFVVWDGNTAYYLIGGGNPDLRNSGATALCLWEAIKFASTVASRFDFEGSMIEPIERFFRAFGASQTPYFSVWKVPSTSLRILLHLRRLR